MPLQAQGLEEVLAAGARPGAQAGEADATGCPGPGCAARRSAGGPLNKVRPVGHRSLDGTEGVTDQAFLRAKHPGGAVGSEQGDVDVASDEPVHFMNARIEPAHVDRRDG